MSDQVTAREVAAEIVKAWSESELQLHGALEDAITLALNAAVAGEWRPIETAPRDGRWLLMVSNDHMHFYRVSWAQVPHGEVWWLSADGRYYGDGLFGGWIECPHLPAAIRSPETAQAVKKTAVASLPFDPKDEQLADEISDAVLKEIGIKSFRAAEIALEVLARRLSNAC